MTCGVFITVHRKPHYEYPKTRHQQFSRLPGSLQVTLELFLEVQGNLQISQLYSAHL